MQIRKELLKKANKTPANSCGECKYYDELHKITPTLTEGWCRVAMPSAMVLSEETCDKWQQKH